MLTLHGALFVHVYYFWGGSFTLAIFRGKNIFNIRHSENLRIFGMLFSQRGS